MLSRFNKAIHIFFLGLLIIVISYGFTFLNYIFKPNVCGNIKISEVKTCNSYLEYMETLDWFAGMLLSLIIMFCIACIGIFICYSKQQKTCTNFFITSMFLIIFITILFFIFL